mmetsp:Transcript_34529/g.32904  ORF Transcript_34529/g.32904 Transcript_34529/m.32904 type:complete len:354 (-) Transcript_34529:1027-2088(-)
MSSTLFYITAAFLFFQCHLFITVNCVAILKIPVIDNSKKNSRLMIRTFLNSAFSGAVSCSLTHSAVCPLDVVKTKLQTDSNLSQKSIKEAVQIIVKSDGIRVLFSGLAATFSGYFLQGFCKFGFYDVIKTKVYTVVKDEDNCARFRLPILLLSATSAEIIACVALCPMEVTRIFIVSNPQLKVGMLSAMKTIVDKDPSGLFKGLGLVMLRQIPYTCAKLAGYEIISDTLKNIIDEKNYKINKINSSNVPISERKASSKILIQLGSGILAGVLAAVISQPADVLLSKVCGEGKNALTQCFIIDSPLSVVRAFQDLGFRTCYSGLQPRAIMVGTLTAMQFVMYEQLKERITKINN